MNKRKFYGERIAYHRDRLRYSRQDFIELLNQALGVSYSAQALYSWEKSKAIPPADLVAPLACLLQINVLELFGYETCVDFAEKNKELVQEKHELSDKLEFLKSENLRLEGKIEATNSFVKELVSRLHSSEEDKLP